MRVFFSSLLFALALGCSASTPGETARPKALAALVRGPAKWATRASPEPPPIPALDLQAARHLLNRFAFGPRPGDLERLTTAGFERWFEEQLLKAPGNPELEHALEPYRSALVPPRELLESWLGEGVADEDAKLNRRIAPFFKDHLARLALSQVTRHVVSERQLEEVMVDFWANHFNVFARKGLVRIFAGDYIERAVRPHALGNFRDLLIATARHPAMLVYLDNAQSRAEKPHYGDLAQPRKGLNENYARELLELHTLGIRSGYTETDVIEVARALTGWSVQRKGPGALGFSFKRQNHDAEPKTILGVQFPAGGGEEDGLSLLSLLSRQPATARHLATKLCARFVADSPPIGCVSAAERAYLESSGDIAQVLRVIARSGDFWSEAARGSKLKTPLEFLVSALRALGARPDGSTELARELARLGEPLLEESVPTGYPDSELDWSSSSGLLARMSFASSLGFGSAKGVRLDLAESFSSRSGEAELETANRLLLSGFASPATLAAANSALDGVDAPDKRRGLALALLLGSPDFQRR